MMRAGMSIPTNIVEGAGQISGKEFGRFVRFALNSSSELEYHLTVARDMNAIKENDFASLSSQVIEVRKMLHGLHKHLMSPAPERHREKSACIYLKPGTSASGNSHPVQLQLVYCGPDLSPFSALSIAPVAGLKRPPPARNPRTV